MSLFENKKFVVGPFMKVSDPALVEVALLLSSSKIPLTTSFFGTMITLPHIQMVVYIQLDLNYLLLVVVAL